MVQQLTDADGNATRAMEALAWASEIARRGNVGDADVAAARVQSASPADFRAAGTRFTRDLRKELDAIMMSNDAEAGLDALLACGALATLLPEVEAMVGFGDGEWRHKDVWKHTKQVVRQSVPRLEIRWSALLHDIGKTKTRSISPDGEVHFFGHAEVGARMFDKMNRRMPLFAHEAKLSTEIRFLILHHLRASQYEASWTDSAVRRFAKEMGEYLEDVLCLSRADITTKRPEKKKRGLRQITDLKERVEKVLAEDAIVPPLPTGIGDAIMKTFAVPPSRLIGDIKRKLEAEIDAGTLASHQPIEFYVDKITKERERYGL